MNGKTLAAAFTTLVMSVAAPARAAVKAAMEDVSIDSFRAAFNNDQKKVRVVAILSPTSLSCQHGHRVLHDTFYKLKDNPNLKGTLIWFPQAPTDTKEVAGVQDSTVEPDNRLSGVWDKDSSFSRLFMKTLKMKLPAWDVYLVYAPGTIWDKEKPPVPDFWMHQQGISSGADRYQFLNPKTFQERVGKLVKAADAPATTP